MSEPIIPVILSGGAGTRLWPLSRKAYCKQFLKLNDGDHTLIQQTVLRVNDASAYTPPIAVCSDQHRFLLQEQLEAINIAPLSVILEPCGRNTAPAMALAALQAVQSGYGESVLLALPSDHVIKDTGLFNQVVQQGKKIAENGHIVIFGIVPTHPETGYGYIKRSDIQIKDGFKVSKFVEKPNTEKAQSFLDAGNFYWNAGIYMFRADAYLSELEKYQPEIYTDCVKAMELKEPTDAYVKPSQKAFESCADLSMDYAVAEKSDKVAVVPYQGHWNDIGGFAALWSEIEHDENENAIQGNKDVVLKDTKSCLIHAENTVVTTAGVENLVIIQTKDAVLVSSKEHAQDVKSIVDTLKEKNREEVTFHRKVYRPWGSFENMDSGEGFQVKRLTVLPKQKLSTQSHKHRSEHWTVVQGSVRVRRGSDVFDLGANQSTYIPVGEVHSLENVTDEPVEIIEVQAGSYLGEDDIVRYDDVYGRAKGDVAIPVNMHKEKHGTKSWFSVPQTVKDALKKGPFMKAFAKAYRQAGYWFDYGWWKLLNAKGPAPQIHKTQTIKNYAKQYGLSTFVETGTLYGETIASVADAFDRSVTIELNEELYTRSNTRFSSDAKIECVRGDSAEMLPTILKGVDKPALFWLDSKYSGGITAKGAKETPICEELQAVLSHPVEGHVVLISDARCFTGTNDYPTLAALRKLVAEKSDRYTVDVAEDIIRIYAT